MTTEVVGPLFWLTPLHKWMITRNAKLHHEKLVKSQWLKPHEIRELQEIVLRRLVLHAYHHVGVYGQKFDAVGIDPRTIVTLDDLRRLPTLTKAEVGENLYFDLLADNHDKRQMQKIFTSGSTGEPFVCFADRHQLEIRCAATLRAMEWAGYRFGDRQVRLWHQTIGMTWA